MGARAVIFLIVFIDLIGFGIVLPMLPVYAEHFGASGFIIGIIVASFSVMQVIFSPFWGRLSDRISGLAAHALFSLSADYSFPSRKVLCYADTGEAVLGNYLAKCACLSIVALDCQKAASDKVLCSP